uniref:Uncharacterized protein n=1 Tax=Rhizophora mucronata TaxID=61149 RepID=A0A2P2JUM7_RHIMU
MTWNVKWDPRRMEPESDASIRGYVPSGRLLQVILVKMFPYLFFCLKASLLIALSGILGSSFINLVLVFG